MPSALVDMLNQDPESPFHGLIKRALPTRTTVAKAVVTDNSLVEAIKESLESRFRCAVPYPQHGCTNTTDTEGIRRLLIIYWSAVRRVSEVWGSHRPDRETHGGVGVRRWDG